MRSPPHRNPVARTRVQPLAQRDRDEWTRRVFVLPVGDPTERLHEVFVVRVRDSDTAIVHLPDG
jgi:hypothetical protein